MEFPHLQEDHIESVVARLWDRGITEAMIFGVEDLHDLAQYASYRMDDKRAYAALEHDDCIAIFGCYPSGTETDQTWFMATDAFDQHFLSLTKGLRRLMERAAVEDGFEILETYSACIHPLAERWFGLLGLQPDPDYNQIQAIRRFYRRFEPCV